MSSPVTKPIVVDVFASSASGSPDIAPPTYMLTGYPAPSGVPVKPPRGYANWLANYAMNGVRFLCAFAISPWDVLEDRYGFGSVVRDIDGRFYVLRGTATTGTHPFADPGNWFPLNMLDRGTTEDYASPIAAWRSVRAQKRFGIDHWGKPCGALYDWVEQWAPGTPFDVGGITNTAVGRWHLISNAGAGNFASLPPGVSAGSNASNTSRALQLAVDGTTSGNRSEVRLNDDSTTSLFTDDSLITLDMDIEAVSVLSVNWVIGFTQVGELVNAITHGAFFIRPSGAGTNWLCRTIKGGSPTEVDSHVLGTAGVQHHFAIHLVGASVDDDSTARALFFIDGVQVANIETTLPINVGAQMIPIFGGTSGGGTVAQVMLCGPVRYSQITALATP